MILNIKIRELDSTCEDEILLVASRMRQTLVEVLGETKGTALYTMEWLVDRVRWHLDVDQTKAKILLAVNECEKNVGHAIARIEKDDSGELFGYFSTVFVEPESRNKGIANFLLQQVELWVRAQDLRKIVYNTAENHDVLIRLFEKNGFKITHRADEMVQLTKVLSL